VIVAFVGLVVLWHSGTFDRPLSEIGLNAKTCATNLFGAKLCGHDLAEWCESNYDADLNADACDDALDEAGMSPPDH